MDRVFKFRAWNRIVGRMQYFTFHDIETLAGKIQWQNLIVMQYTGARDCNGKDIYEGDIVKVKGTKTVGEYVTSIEWHHVGFRMKENKTYLLDGRLLPSSLEVIGNIYHDKKLICQE